MKIRDLDHMPFDKMFEVTSEGNEELCHATGIEVCFDEDTNDPANWWNQYIDSYGNMHYGR